MNIHIGIIILAFLCIPVFAWWSERLDSEVEENNTDPNDSKLIGPAIWESGYITPAHYWREQ